MNARRPGYFVVCEYVAFPPHARPAGLGLRLEIIAHFDTETAALFQAEMFNKLDNSPSPESRYFVIEAPIVYCRPGKETVENGIG